MNDEIKNKLLQYLQSVEGSIEKAVDFTSEQAPLYVQELCQIGFVENGVKCAACLLACFFTFLVYLAIQYCMRSQSEESRALAATFPGIIGASVSVVAIAGCVDYGIEAYKAAYTPRVYIVEKLHEMTK